jgi:hypothetical protein
MTGTVSVKSFPWFDEHQLKANFLVTITHDRYSVCQVVPMVRQPSAEGQVLSQHYRNAWQVCTVCHYPASMNINWGQVLCHNQCCGSGMFYPGSGSDQFLILDPGSGSKNFFHPGSYMKSGMQTYRYFFLFLMLSGANFWVLVMVKKDLGSRG